MLRIAPQPRISLESAFSSLLTTSVNGVFYIDTAERAGVSKISNVNQMEPTVCGARDILPNRSEFGRGSIFGLRLNLRRSEPDFRSALEFESVPRLMRFVQVLDERGSGV